MDSTISAIVAVAGTILGAVLAYVFQNRASERAESSALYRQLRTERMSVYSSYITALTEFNRGQMDWYFRRKEDSGSAAASAAMTEAYRLKGIAQALLAQVRLVASDQAVIDTAADAFDRARLVDNAPSSEELRSRVDKFNKKVESFTALAAAEIQSAPATGRGRRTRPEVQAASGSPPVQQKSAANASTQNDPHEPDPSAYQPG